MTASKPDASPKSHVESLNALPTIEREKLKNMMLAHLDGVYVFSAREDCDKLVTELIRMLVERNGELKSAKRELEVLKEETKGWIPV